MYDLIIIGGGPAGLTAGIYACREGISTLLIEDPVIPSQAVITAQVENYPGFPDPVSGHSLLNKMKRQAERFGIETVSGHTVSVRKENGAKWRVILEDRYFEAFSVIIAAGAYPRPIGVPGEEKFKGRGVSYCAVCDGAFFRGKKVIVVGGGNTAVEETLFLAGFAEEIKVIHRRDRLRASKILQDRVMNNKKIGFVWNSVVREISGDKRVEGVRILNLKTNEERFIEADGVFVFAGYVPNTGFIKGVVDMDEDGYICSGPFMDTSAAGIYVCGDCRKNSIRQIISACGDGAAAAVSGRHYVDTLKGTAYD